MTMEIDSCCKQCHRGPELAYSSVDSDPGNAIVGKFQKVLQDQRKLVMALKSFSFWTLELQRCIAECAQEGSNVSVPLYP